MSRLSGTPEPRYFPRSVNRFSLQPCAGLEPVLSLYHSLVLLAVSVMDVSLWLRGFLMVLVTLNYFWQRRRYQLWSQRRLVFDSGQGWLLGREDGWPNNARAIRQKSLAPVSCRFFFASPWLVACRISLPDASVPSYLIFRQRSATSEDWRQLHLMLKHLSRDDGQFRDGGQLHPGPRS